MEMKSTSGKFSLALTYLVRVIYALLTFAFGLYYIGVGIYFGLQPPYFAYQATFNIAFGILLVLLCVCGFFKAHHWFFAFLLMGACVLGFFMLLWEPFLRNSRLMVAWIEFHYVLWIYAGIFAFGLVVGLVQFMVSMVLAIQEYKKSAKKKQDGLSSLHPMQSKARIFSAIMIGIIVCLAFLTLGLYQRWFVGNRTITLYPGNYNIEFAGYGDLNPDTYSPEVRASMDKHAILMVIHPGYWVSYETFTAHPDDWMDGVYTSAEYIAGKADFITKTNYWKTNYPHVKLISLVHGMPCGFTTDYSVTNSSTGVGGTIWMMEQVLKTAVEANLTNIMGVHTDQEDCAEDWFSIDEPETRNRERNNAATQTYMDFLGRLALWSQNSTWQTFFGHQQSLYGQDHFIITTTYGAGQTVDTLDGDYDLNVFSMNNILPIPYDEFLPMLYNEGAPTPDDAHFRLFIQMSVLYDTLQREGYENRIGALLGVVNEGIFRYSDSFTQWDGTRQSEVKGFDVLAQQARIVKAFNATRVSFFVFHNCCGFIGAFDGYGANFLDRLNETLNGPDANKPFTILYRPEPLLMQTDMVRDLLLGEKMPIYIIYIFGLGVALIIPRALSKKRINGEPPSEPHLI